MSSELEAAAQAIEENAPELLEPGDVDGGDKSPEVETDSAEETSAHPESGGHAGATEFEPWRPKYEASQIQQVTAGLQSEYQQIQTAYQQVQQVASTIDWQRLQAENPGAFQAAWAHYQADLARINTRAVAFQQAYGNVEHELQQELGRKQEHHLRVESAKVQRALGDEWNQQTRNEIAAYLQDLGYSNEQINTVSARDVILAHRALRGSQPAEEPVTRRRPISAGRRAEQEIQRRGLRDHSLQAAEVRIDALIQSGQIGKRKRA